MKIVDKLKKIRFEQLEVRSQITQSFTTPQQVLTILHQAKNMGRIGDLLELYEKIVTTDTRIGGQYSSIEVRVSSCPIFIEPNNQIKSRKNKLAEEYAKIVEDGLRNIDKEYTTRQFIIPYFRGVFIGQPRWTVGTTESGKQVYQIDGLDEIPLRAINSEVDTNSKNYGDLKLRFERTGKYKFLKDYSKLELFTLTDANHKAKWDIAGVGRRILAVYLGKIQAQAKWTSYLETYGEPMRIIRYPEGTGDEEREELIYWAQMLGDANYAVLPEGFDVEIREFNTSSSNSAYREYIDTANIEIAIALLGQTQTSDGGKYGSFAKANIHNLIRHEFLAFIKSIVERGYRQLSEMILEANYGLGYDKALIPNIVLSLPTPEDKKAKVDTLDILKNMIPISEEFMYKEFAIPKPKNGEKVLQKESKETGKKDGSTDKLQQSKTPKKPSGESKGKVKKN